MPSHIRLPAWRLLLFNALPGRPGTTAGEILRELHLQGYLLSTGPNSTSFFGETENVYPRVQDGDKLFASTRAEVGV
jgi:hypothetical protein